MKILGVNMNQVEVNINGIMLYCDDSVSQLKIGNKYVVCKQYFNNLSYKNAIVDGTGQINPGYLGSLLQDNSGERYFMCIHKSDCIEIKEPRSDQSRIFITTDMCEGEGQLAQYKQQEMEYLHMVFSLLRIFKSGNIGPLDIFFDFNFTLYGTIKCNPKMKNYHFDRNIIDNRLFTLEKDEEVACNFFIKEYIGIPYFQLKNCIDKFIWGLEQVDYATGFEQYISTLEMLLLKHGENKKIPLAKRVAVLLGTEINQTRELYEKMKELYKYRSESVHEGNVTQITANLNHELENITRNVIKKCLRRFKDDSNQNNNIQWKDVKNNQIEELKEKVRVANEQGVFSDQDQEEK